MTEKPFDTGDKTAIILLSAGGPDKPSAVRESLKRRFSDAAYVDLPPLLRKVFAPIWAASSAKIVKEKYAAIGGKSPAAEQAQQLAESLQSLLVSSGEFQVFSAQTYGAPFAEEVAKKVKSYQPKNIVILPLCAFEGMAIRSSLLNAWNVAAQKARIDDIEPLVLSGFSTQDGFGAGQMGVIREGYFGASAKGNPRVLFAIENMVDTNGSYHLQAQQAMEETMRVLGIPDADAALCAQPEAQGHLPSVRMELYRAAADAVPIILVPFSEITESLETLVDMDVTYRKEAEAQGVVSYRRLPALYSNAVFVEMLADHCLEGLGITKEKDAFLKESVA